MQNKKTNYQNKSKGGRPAKGEDKLTVPINLRLTKSDYNSVKEKADIFGISPTQYARAMVLNGSIKSRYTLEELDLIRKVAGMANNLNQIAKQANKSGFALVGAEIAHIAIQVKGLIDDR